MGAKTTGLWSAVAMFLGIALIVAFAQSRRARPTAAPPAEEAVPAPLRDAGALVERDRRGRVTSLEVYGTRLTDEGLRSLARLTRLERLSLRETGIGDEALEHLAGLGTLRVLDLGGNQITDAGLEHVAALDRLESLALDNTSWSESRMQISDAGLQRLAPLCRLRRLDLSSTRVSLAVTAEGLHHLANFPELESLRLGGDRITDRAMEHVARCRNLRALALLYTSVGDAGLARIGDLERLEAVSLSSRHLTDRGLAHLAELPKLRHAQLRTTGLTDRALERLGRVKTLERLDLYGSGEAGLDLGRSFTSVGLAHLADLPNLKTLWLSNVETDEAAVDVLKRFTQLRTLHAFCTSLSRDQLEDLQAALPDTEVSATAGGGAWWFPGPDRGRPDRKPLETHRASEQP